MAHSVSHEPPPPPPLFSFLKKIQCLAVKFNLDSKCGTKDRHWFKQKSGVQFLNSPADLDHLCRLHPLSPEEVLVLLLYVPSQQLWSLRDGQFT